jgi:hypothetical protein
VDFVHLCSFCGWSRAAETPVVLPAGCPDCGCPADSTSRADHERGRLAAAAEPERFVVPFALRLVGMLLALVFAFAFARAGYAFGGVPGAITALGLSGFLLLPFVPDRV